MKYRLMLLSLAAALLLTGCGVAPSAAETPETEAAAVQTPANTPGPAPTAAPARQAGSLKTVLLDGKGLLAEAAGYTFLAGDRLELRVKASNGNGNRATVWFLITGLNGWDVRNQQQAMTVVPLSPGEAREETISFDLSESMAQYLRLDVLQEITLSVEGYVDSSEYEYTMAESDVSIPDGDPAYTQAYGEGWDVLLDNDFLTFARCGEAADTGVITLYCHVKKPVVNAGCKLYPIVNGVYDTEAYLALDKIDMSTEAKRLLQWTPAVSDAGRVSALYAVAEGAAMAPGRLDLPDDGRASVNAAFASLPVLAENELVCIRYDGAARRLLAENRTEEQTLLLAGGAVFQLDGGEVKANPQSILLFPGCASAFRISGRGKDAAGVERNISIQPDNRTLSATWTILACENGLDAPVELGQIAAKEFSLQ